jgi:hypothetical protein
VVKGAVLVHIPFTLGYRPSGGGVRPRKMIEAFERQGFQVEVIAGSHGERAEQFKNLKARIQSGETKLHFVYSESSSNPTILTDRRGWFRFRDFFYLRWLHKRHIPIALYYRDCHWAFSVAGKDYSLVKWALLKFLHYVDLAWYLSFVDMLLLPSMRMKPFVPWSGRFKKVDELPPGHDVLSVLPNKEIPQLPKAIYVGGVLPPIYDISSLFKKPPRLAVTICCREDEWQNVQDYYGQPPEQVKVTHLSGEALNRELQDSHVALMIRENHSYLGFSQPLKFYEAIGYELPVMVTEGSLVAEQVRDWGIGWVAKDSAAEIKRDEYQEKIQNLRRLKAEHTWDARVRKLAGMLDT